LLDIPRDAQQSLLGASRAFLVVLDVSLEVLDSVLGCAQLQRDLLGDVKRVLAILFRDDRRLLQHSQYGLPCLIERIADAGTLLSWRGRILAYIGNDAF
jgi:hypothetical protein